MKFTGVTPRPLAPEQLKERMPSPEKPVKIPDVNFATDTETGCVIASTASGAFLGRFASRAIAESTVTFLRRR